MHVEVNLKQAFFKTLINGVFNLTKLIFLVNFKTVEKTNTSTCISDTSKMKENNCPEVKKFEFHYQFIGLYLNL